MAIGGYRGLATYARQVDPDYGDALLLGLDEIRWPV